MVLTGREWLIAQGEPMANLSSKFPCYIEHVLADLPVAEQKRVAGNSMEATCAGFFLLYFLANVREKQTDAGYEAASSSASLFWPERSGDVPLLVDDDGVIHLEDED